MKSFPETAHQFAFYCENVAQIRANKGHDLFELTDSELVARISTILRLERNDRITLFDNDYQVHALIAQIDPRKSVLLQIQEILPNKQLTPLIQWILPLLKKEAFEEALYSLTEMGATIIQPVLTKKTTRFFGGDKEMVRCQNIMRAAAEQSKQFVVPILQPIIPLDVWLLKSQCPTSLKIFFDPAGLALKEILQVIQQKEPTEIIAFAGPEGDLTYEEKMQLTDNEFLFCALTQTVLRAQQAINVGLGSLRSLLNNL